MDQNREDGMQTSIGFLAPWSISSHPLVKRAHMTCPIDVRSTPLPAHIQCHLRSSINVAVQRGKPFCRCRSSPRAERPPINSTTASPPRLTDYPQSPISITQSLNQPGIRHAALQPDASVAGFLEMGNYLGHLGRRQLNSSPRGIAPRVPKSPVSSSISSFSNMDTIAIA
ncbi:hypothetical protein BU16DRAFT_52944 [Lophium mytilinum]|uniref:Uncharacterized protein n=1 Tax=Lophium mytilinum TaxID=390894 RepID=A0A6A6QP14_9PEZI|nr:hypothetical protein BU16DRAFT_52944 [Lophium mytilinum]